jgi:hypothetical protein
LKGEASFGALAAEAQTAEDKLKLVETKRKYVAPFMGCPPSTSMLVLCTGDA